MAVKLRDGKGDMCIVNITVSAVLWGISVTVIYVFV